MEIAPGIHQIEQVRGANSYLALGTEGNAIIDTGMPGNEERIIKYLRNIEVEPKAIQYIILTHSDPDHSGSVAKPPAPNID